MPLHPDERRFCAAKVGDRFLLFRVLPMGSKGAPLVWLRYAAWISRVGVAAFEPGELRLQTYVDDPLACAAGTPEHRRHLLAQLVAWFLLVGFPCTWSKMRLGASAEWIGAELSFWDFVPLFGGSAVRVAIPPSRRAEVLALVEHALVVPVIRRDWFRTLAGKLAFVATVIVYIRPFLNVFWKLGDSRGAPSGSSSGLPASEGPGSGGPSAARDGGSRLPWALVHTRRARPSLLWVRAFLRGDAPLLQRFLPCLGEPPPTHKIQVDASPWGMGGILLCLSSGRILSYFAVGVDNDDCEALRARPGVSDFNTSWEALAILIAVRGWLADRGAITATVVSDSLAALGVVGALSSTEFGLNRVARELALDLALSRYALNVVEHLPGVANVVPDALSRLSAPEPKPFPSACLACPRMLPPPRTPSWWRASGY